MYLCVYVGINIVLKIWYVLIQRHLFPQKISLLAFLCVIYMFFVVISQSMSDIHIVHAIIFLYLHDYYIM
jgi:hypothetical protein